MGVSGHISFSAGELAERLGGVVRGFGGARVTGLESLDHALPGHLTFIRSGKFAKAWASSRASAALVSKGIELSAFDESARAAIIVPDADLAMNAVLELFMPPPHGPATGRHISAVIEPGCDVHPTARIGPHVSVGQGCVIEQNAVLHAGVRLGGGVRIGAGAVLNAGVVVLDRCVIGPRCILHANAVVGADGFGYRFDPALKRLVKVPHIGHVEIGADVEIGSCTTIDRGKFGATVIGPGTKIDNLVQIAHNVRIGSGVVICGCAGVAGSAVIGNGVMIGGSAGVSDGVTVGDGAQIAACAAVMSDVPPRETVAGIPAIPRRDWARMQIALRRLGDRSESKPETPA